MSINEGKGVNSTMSMDSESKLGVKVTTDDRITLSPALKAVQPFVVGGLAGCFATTMVQPIDMVKVRVQLIPPASNVSRNPLLVAWGIYKESGFRAFYKGLDAGLLRQITYSTTRFGLYNVVSDWLKGEEKKPLKLHESLFAGFVAGGVGSWFGGPAEIALIRLQTDQTLPKEQRRHYTGVFNAVTRIIREEGFFGLWKGAAPTVWRAIFLNMGMMVSFDRAKENLEKFFSKNTSQIGAAAISGVVAVAASYPLDVAKTKIQRMKKDPITQKLPYRGMVHCMMETYSQAGLKGFYKGSFTYYCRIAPHVMLSWFAWEFLQSVIKQHCK